MISSIIRIEKIHFMMLFCVLQSFQSPLYCVIHLMIISSFTPSIILLCMSVYMWFFERISFFNLYLSRRLSADRVLGISYAILVENYKLCKILFDYFTKFRYDS